MWEGFGGAERDRTAGLLVANEALSQLSYSPTPSDFYILPAILKFRNWPSTRSQTTQSRRSPFQATTFARRDGI
jgi:hypothetical protein